jgi:DNA-binding transcriptional LysR family regulator
MMSPFTGIEAFVLTAEHRSFRRAAAQLGVSPAAVSKAVATLERRLGVRLLERTSRRVRPTSDGAAYLVHCRAALDHLRAGEDGLSGARAEPDGVVRVSASVVCADVLLRALPDLLTAHAALSVDLRITDRHVRLFDEDIDVAVRIGALEDSSLIARRLRRPRWVTVASPAYLAREGTPTTPAALADHACWKFITPHGRDAAWAFAGVSVDVPTTHRTSHGPTLVGAARAGLGVVQAFDFFVQHDLDAGSLVEVLAPYATDAPAVHALCRPGRQHAPEVRVVLDALVEAFG